MRKVTFITWLPSSKQITPWEISISTDVLREKK